jgi:hypothetical protein
MSGERICFGIERDGARVVLSLRGERGGRLTLALPVRNMSALQANLASACAEGNEDFAAAFDARGDITALLVPVHAPKDPP